MFALIVSACGSTIPDSTTLGRGGTTATVSSPFFDGKTSRIEINEQALIVAVADERSERSQGLMGVTDLGEIDGMMFVFPQPLKAKFSMRDTLIPLDIWFIDESGIIVTAYEMQPCDADPCTQYDSVEKIALAVEAPLGVFDFAVGDHLSSDFSG